MLQLNDGLTDSRFIASQKRNWEQSQEDRVHEKEFHTIALNEMDEFVNIKLNDIENRTFESSSDSRPNMDQISPNTRLSSPPKKLWKIFSIMIFLSLALLGTVLWQNFITITTSEQSKIPSFGIRIHQEPIVRRKAVDSNAVLEMTTSYFESKAMLDAGFDTSGNADAHVLNHTSVESAVLLKETNNETIT